MKKTVVITAAVLSLLFLLPSAKCFPDEIADLKAQIGAMEKTIAALKTKVEALEGRQDVQAKEVKKLPELQKNVEEIKRDVSSGKKGLLDGISVGGHLKLYMFDRSEGKRNGVEQHNNVSAGMHHLYLYFRKEIEEWLGIDVETDTSVTAAATPVLGSDISRSSSSSVSTTIHQAYMTLRLPYQFEAKVGLFNPMFDEDYAKEVWWDQLYHLPGRICQLQGWHDSGVELYRNFDFPKWSLPVHLSYLNGNTNATSDDRFVDNNEAKSVLLHVGPEFFNNRLRLLGAFAYGKWDDEDDNDMWRWAAGANLTFKKLEILGQYLYTKWDDLSLTGGGTEDGRRQGFYIKGLYRFNDKWRAILQYSLMQLYNTESSFMRTDRYKDVTFGLNYFLTGNSVIIGQVSFGEGNRSDNSEKIKYIRSTLGWRTTF